MLNTSAIYDELKDTMDAAAARQIAFVIGRVYNELQHTATKTELNGLTNALGALAAAQKRTEERLEELANTVETLASAQARTEERVEELAAAQARTEERVEELAIIMNTGFKSLQDQIAALGGRWGIYNEGTFRATIYGIFEKTPDVEVREGYYGGRQVDIIIRNGEHILLEITSRMHPKDIEKLYRSADDYAKREGVEPLLMVATSYVGPKLMKTIMGLERKIEIFSYETE